MVRDYYVVSPSLDGILSDNSLSYEGLKRPSELLRVLDGPSSKGQLNRGGDDGGEERGPHKQRILEQYLHDLYGIFMKKLSYLITESEVSTADTVKLQAILQEIIKIKGLLNNSK